MKIYAMENMFTKKYQWSTDIHKIAKQCVQYNQEHCMDWTSDICRDLSLQYQLDNLRRTETNLVHRLMSLSDDRKTHQQEYEDVEVQLHNIQDEIETFKDKNCYRGGNEDDLIQLYYKQESIHMSAARIIDAELIDDNF